MHHPAVDKDGCTLRSRSEVCAVDYMIDGRQLVWETEVVIRGDGLSNGIERLTVT